MTLVNIDLRNQGYETGPDDRVIFYSLLVREGEFGTISTAPVEVPLVDGKGSKDLAPGPVGVQIIAGQVADTRVREGRVPMEGPTTLNVVLTLLPEYSDAVRESFLAAIRSAQDTALTRIDAEVAVAVDAEMGGVTALSGEALSRAKNAEGVASTANSKANTATSAASSAVSTANNAAARVTALEAMNGVSPESPVDGQSANLISQSDTLTRTAVNTVVRGATGIFPVEQYGAVGDGVTDDTAAIQAAVDAARDTGGGTVLFQAGKTYVVTMVYVDQGIILEGYGATIFRPAMTPNWTRMFTSQGRGYLGMEDSDRPTIIRGLTLDGNMENQGPYESYEQEQSSLVFFSGSNQQPGRAALIVEDVTVKRSVSDGIHTRDNINVIVRNLTAIDCFRGGLTLTGGNSEVRVDGYRGGGTITGAHIDLEVDGAGYGGSYRQDVYLRDVVEYTKARQSVNIAGSKDSILRVSDSRILSGIYFGGGASLHVQDSEIDTYQGVFFNAVLDSTETIFTRVRFNGHYNGTGTAPAVVVVRPVGDTPEVVTFNDCEFVVKDDGGVTDWRAIKVEHAANLDTRVEVNGGTIVTNAVGVQILSGTSIIGGGVKIDAPTPIHVNNDGIRPQHTTIGDVKFGPTVTREFYTYSSFPNSWLTHEGTVIDETANGAGEQTGIDGGMVYSGRRIVMVSAPPAAGVFGIIGDIARLKTPAAGAIYEWVCTKTGTSGSIWKPLTTIPA